MELQRAHTVFEIKALDGDQRILEGFASTPVLDYQSHTLNPKGAQFTLPMPLLWQHQQDKPIGTILRADVTDRGIRIKAQIARGVLPYIEDAWALIKSGLVRGFSVGWKPLETPTQTKSGGLYFDKWLWGETSAVTIPANATATIDLIKSLDGRPVLSGAPPTIPSHTSPAVVGAVPSGRTAMTPNSQPIAEQITAATAALQTKHARLQELNQRHGVDGGLEPDEVTERAALVGEVDGMAMHLKSLRASEAAQAAMAAPVYSMPAPVQTRTTQSYVPSPQPQIEVKSTIPVDVEFTRYLICRMVAVKAAASGLFVNPIELAKQYYPDQPRIQWALKAGNDWMQKDNVPAATTTDATFAGPLVNTTLSQAFVEYLRPQTIIGRLQGMTRVDFNTRIAGQTSGATGYWVGQGQSKPLTRFAFNQQTLTWTKVAAIIALTEELARFSSPSAEDRIRTEIVNALRERIDLDFVDPSSGAVAGVRPASITNGITPLADSGNTLANVTTDLAQFFNAFSTQNMSVRDLVWIMPETVALQLSLMRDSAGALAFPTISVAGGTWQGIPVVTSNYLLFGHTPANNKVILVHTPSIAIADDGGFQVDVSREASLEMDDQPVMASSSTAGSPSGPTGSALVSMFQTNSIAIRAERFINWARLRNTGVVWMDDVRWAA